KRILIAVPTLVGVSILVFLLVHMVPGDPIDVMLGPRATEETRQTLEARLGLDQPLPVRYWNWATDVARGDWGRSIRSREPVMDQILRRLPATLELSVTALVIAFVIGIVFGVTAARRRNTAVDHAAVGFSLVGVSVPVFWLGLMLMFLFSVALGWLPVSGRIMSGARITRVTGFYLIDTLLGGSPRLFVNALRHLILPAASLATISFALITRITRSSMLDVLHEDYIRTARAKGLSARSVVYKHALKNAMIPVVTVTGLQLGMLIGGSILTETVFSWPGIGRLVIQAINNRDYPMVQGVVLFISGAFIVINIVVDAIYAILDPRIRYE
ncbi:MAG: ABC transporter permease, partial [Spirochaetaceae bacterium]